MIMALKGSQHTLMIRKICSTRELRNRTSYIVHGRRQAASRRFVTTSAQGLQNSALHSLRIPRNARELPKSYIVHRTSYIGRPRLPPPSRTFVTTPDRDPWTSLRTCFAKFPQLRCALFQIVHRTSYIVHRQTPSAPAFPHLCNHPRS